MKNIFILFSLLSVGIVVSDEWVGMSSSVQKKPDINVLSSDFENTLIEFKLPGFNQRLVEINGKEHIVISFPESAANLDAGFPDLPSISKSLVETFEFLYFTIWKMFKLLSSLIFIRFSSFLFS